MKKKFGRLFFYLCDWGIWIQCFYNKKYFLKHDFYNKNAKNSVFCKKNENFFINKYFFSKKCKNQKTKFYKKSVYFIKKMKKNEKNIKNLKKKCKKMLKSIKFLKKYKKN